MNNILAEKDTQTVNKIIIDQLEVTADQVTPEAELIADLGADSLDIMEITMNLEQQFNISIPDEKSDQVKTVGSLYEALAELLMQSGRTS